MELPKKFNCDACYACPSNRERNLISAGNFRQHILDTHPLYDTDKSPTEHTIVVEAEICSANNELKGMTIDTVLRHNIITTYGDDSVKYSTQKIDPALCLYAGAFLMCLLPNKFLTASVPRGNGKLCRLISTKMKNIAPSYLCKHYYGRKVWTVCATHLDWIEVEHVAKNRRNERIRKRDL